MNCAVCNKEMVLHGDDNPTHLPVSKYWSYEENGDKRPYCSCACGLSEYVHDLADEDSPSSKP